MGTKLLLAANAPLKELDTQIDSNDSSYFFHMSKRSKSLINHSQRLLFEFPTMYILVSNLQSQHKQKKPNKNI